MHQLMNWVEALEQTTNYRTETNNHVILFKIEDLVKYVTETFPDLIKTLKSPPDSMNWEVGFYPKKSDADSDKIDFCVAPTAWDGDYDNTINHYWMDYFNDDDKVTNPITREEIDNIYKPFRETVEAYDYGHLEP